MTMTCNTEDAIHGRITEFNRAPDIFEPDQFVMDVRVRNIPHWLNASISVIGHLRDLFSWVYTNQARVLQLDQMKSDLQTALKAYHNDGIIIRQERHKLVAGFIRKYGVPTYDGRRLPIIPSFLFGLFMQFVGSTSIKKCDEFRSEINMFRLKSLKMERMMVQKICCCNYRISSHPQIKVTDEREAELNATILESILTKWSKERRFVDCREEIMESMTSAMKRSDVKSCEVVYHYLIKCMDADFVNNAKNIEKDLIYCIDYCLENSHFNVFDCIVNNLTELYKDAMSETMSEGLMICLYKSLANKSSAYATKMCELKDLSIGWNEEMQKKCFKNAVKYHHDNMTFINFIFDKLTEGKDQHTLKCGKLMEYCIEYDYVHVAKELIDRRWHRLSEENEMQAQVLGMRCSETFEELRKALEYYQENDGSGYKDDATDDWVVDDEEGEETDFESDDSWMNAVSDDE